METIVGTFTSINDARNAVTELRATGLDEGHTLLLTPSSEGSALGAIETNETEQPGLGKAIGAVAGGAAGAFAGLSVVATVLVPGLGPIALLAMAAGATAGGLGGATLGDALEKSLGGGLPIDDIYVYEDALRRGRAVVISQVTAAGDRPESVRAVLDQNGAESIDAAREEMWAGLRSAEQRTYETEGGDFSRDESAYRIGFEAAHIPAIRDKSEADAEAYLRQRYPRMYDGAAFRRGFARGRAHQGSVTIL